MAADFFTTEVWTLRGLVTYYTIFVIELHSPRVQVVASTSHPDHRERNHQGLDHELIDGVSSIGSMAGFVAVHVSAAC